MNLIKKYRGLTLLVSLVAIVACSTVPMTQRKQLILLPDSELLRLSIDNYGQVLADSTLSTDPKEIEPVVRVGEKLAAATERYLQDQGLPVDGYKWEFKVIKDDETVNAWCMPGGKIAVYTGILPLTQNDDGLAVVMAHEIAHAVAKHGNERMSQDLMKQFGGIALSTVLREKTQRTQDSYMKAYAIGSQYGVLMPYGRMQESESDRIGLILMAMAGYNPDEAVPFWQRMGAGRQSVPEFLSTHPAPESRIANIQTYLPEARSYYRR